ncbi:cutinase family protein [Kibdelosporangium persicum]|uniref:Type IV secretory pathway, VirJ component n=1 Tax=Kibdelosporangium persicum TaxID=2698649 RepID=A0ABX2FFQ2_9PSEU|nr:cutinase family protein [Kibdelosporangium persicum]NRN70053.1 Type IV secretory pathway, VirJ component [Kibdelosporangium persicum]
MFRSPFRTFAVVAVVLAGGVAAAATPAAAAPCTDIDVVSARGTFEPGTLGIIVGDPVYSAIQRQVRGKSTTAHPVDYPANLDLSSATKGNVALVDHVTSQARSCPNQRFVLVGYSQGANVVSNSIGVSSAGAPVGAPIAATIPAPIEPRVAAVVVFGPPIGSIGKHITGTYQSRTKEYCAQGDPVCERGGNDVGAHLSYFRDADDAAAFVAGKV